MLAVAAVLSVAPAAAGGSTQRAGGYVIGWPSASSLAAMSPGDAVRVSLVRRAGARHRLAVVSLLRVASSGRPIAVVARRRVRRRGTFTARLPAGRAGRYRLRVAIAGSRWSRSFRASPAPSVPAPVPGPAPVPVPPFPSCFDFPDVRGTLGVAPASTRPGQTMTMAVTNTGTSCLRTGYGARWQIYRDGDWDDIPLNRPVPAILLYVQPGNTFTEDFLVPQDAVPGRYRLLKQINFGGPSIDVTAEVTVNP